MFKVTHSRNIKALHLINTSQGGRWASSLAGVLTREGVGVHVALPDAEGTAVGYWRASGAHVHRMDFRLSPARVFDSVRQLRSLVAHVQPDLIHAHTLTTALLARLALRWHTSLPRIFHVPGPFHLEHGAFRIPEVGMATSQDYWIATSRAIRSHYIRAGVDPHRVFLSYAGTDNSAFNTQSSGWLRRQFGLSKQDFIVGNVNHVYSPVRFLIHQKTGVKCHEDLIDGISIAAEKDSSIRGVLIGGPWGSDTSYFERLQRYAAARSRGAVIMPGAMSASDVARAIPDFDCAAHVPVSENCGGVVEPLLCGIPVIASRVGGLPEVIMDGLTGITVPPRDPATLAEAILYVRNHYPEALDRAQAGRTLAETMFTVKRTGLEVFSMYQKILGAAREPIDEFDARRFVLSAPQFSR